MRPDQLAHVPPGVVIAQGHHGQADLGEDAQPEQGGEVDPDGILITHYPAPIHDHPQRVGRTEHVADDPGRTKRMTRIPEKIKARQGEDESRGHHHEPQEFNRDPPILAGVFIKILEHDTLLKGDPTGRGYACREVRPRLPQPVARRWFVTPSRYQLKTCIFV